MREQSPTMVPTTTGAGTAQRLTEQGPTGQGPGPRRLALSAVAMLFVVAGYASATPAWAANEAQAETAPPPLETLEAEDPAAIVAATRGLVLVDLYADW